MKREEIRRLAELAVDYTRFEYEERRIYVKGYMDGFEKSTVIQWIDVYDHLPENDEAVLVYNGKFTEYCVCDGRNFYNSHSIEINHVRYWMPIPNPPKD